VAERGLDQVGVDRMQGWRVVEGHAQDGHLRVAGEDVEQAGGGVAEGGAGGAGGAGPGHQGLHAGEGQDVVAVAAEVGRGRRGGGPAELAGAVVGGGHGGEVQDVGRARELLCAGRHLPGGRAALLVIGTLPGARDIVLRWSSHSRI